MMWQSCSCSGVCSKGVRNTCVPSNSPSSKLSNAKRYEGVTTMCELALESRERTAACKRNWVLHWFIHSMILELSGCFTHLLECPFSPVKITLPVEWFRKAMSTRTCLLLVLVWKVLDYWIALALPLLFHSNCSDNTAVLHLNCSEKGGTQKKTACLFEDSQYQTRLSLSPNSSLDRKLEYFWLNCYVLKRWLASGFVSLKTCYH